MNWTRNIKSIRERKNLTQEFMAQELGISQNSYSNLENGGVKLTIERLMEISKVLGVSAEELITNEAQTFNFHNSNIEKFYGFIETLHEDNKELIQTTIKVLSDQVEYLQRENQRLIKLLESK
jgi:transcriptional regulator with XRE-family HTH domain